MNCPGKEIIIDLKRIKRRSIRLQGFDYSRAGAYFVTICTHDRQPLLGEIVDGEMVLNEMGRIVEEEIKRTESIREYIAIDKHVIMPNHVHIIFFINDDRRGTAGRAQIGKMINDCRVRDNTNENAMGTARCAPTTVERFQRPVAMSIPTIVRSFKSAVTKRINVLRHTPGNSVWQRNYYEHVIRNEQELNRIRRYIINNPPQWEYDRENHNEIPIYEKKKFWERFLNEF